MVWVVGVRLRLLLAFGLLMVVPISSVSACGGWQATPEGRTACCAHHEPCDGAEGRSHATSQAAADRCCAASEPRPAEQASHAVASSTAPADVEPPIAPEMPPVRLMPRAALDVAVAAVSTFRDTSCSQTFLIQTPHPSCRCPSRTGAWQPSPRLPAGMNGRDTVIHSLVELSLKNRLIVLVLYVGLAGWGWWAMSRSPVDAIPDLSDNQVIVFTDWTGRSPQEVEDQVTYPLTVSLQGLPGVRVVRSGSAFGFSMIFVIFEDDVDLYFARSRVLERLNLVTRTLPPGVVPRLARTRPVWVTSSGTRSRAARTRCATCEPYKTGSFATS